MELHQIRYFLALARSLNFTRAAEHCNVTQPALTKAVQKLELELGGVLIHRERQRTQLTDLGKLVLPMLERAYAAAESVRTSAEEFQRTENAPLKVALASCVSAAIIETPLAEIARFMPGLHIELIGAEPAALSDLLLSGDANAAICGDDVGELPVRIDRWSLFQESFSILIQRDSILAGMSEITTEVLAEAVWLDQVGGAAGRPLRGLFPSGIEPKIGHRGHHPVHLQHMVAAGLGVMLWPEHMPHLPSLLTRPVAGSPIHRTVQLLVVAGRRYSPALEALVKIARVHDWRASFPSGAPPLARRTQCEARSFTEDEARMACA